MTDGKSTSDWKGRAKAGQCEITDFLFDDGRRLDVTLAYRTLGTLDEDAGNAVMLLHGTTGSGQQFLRPSAADFLFGSGQPLDVSKFFVILPDAIGHGDSSRPSDGLGPDFPRYGYGDIVEGQYQLLVHGLGIERLRLLLGTSMGGMQTWMWGERYPAMADALMPIASQPIPMAGRNWLWRQMVTGAIRNDPGWHGGDYAAQPTQWTRVMPIFAIMTGNAARLQAQAPDRASATRLYDSLVEDAAKYDANDVLYWFESSWDYDPSPQLAQIQAPLYAVNFADDLINATDLSVMQQLVAKVPHGRYVEIPESAQSYGHQTLAHPEVWKAYLADLLSRTGHP
jgi:homoserine O-acetyltransferase/O-succinyltransferase